MVLVKPGSGWPWSKKKLLILLSLAKLSDQLIGIPFQYGFFTTSMKPDLCISFYKKKKGKKNLQRKSSKFSYLMQINNVL